MKKVRTVGLILLVGVVAAAGVIGMRQKAHSAPAQAVAVTPSGQKSADTIRFAANAPQLAFLKVKTVDSFPEPLVESLNARVAYDDNRTARVYSPINGRVTRIVAETGITVRAGDPLLILDSPDFALAVSDSAKSEADLLRKKEAYERAKQLYEAKGLARKDLEQAEADIRQADAEMQRAKSRLKNLHGDASGTEGQFILRAPVAGTVSERQVNAGSEVRPDAQTPLFVITDPQHLWVLVDLPERQLSKIRVGQPVAIEVDAYPEEVFFGKVAVISETLDPVTRRVQVRCEVNNAAAKLKPEMFARVMPVADEKNGLPRVPNAAIFTIGLYSYLFVETEPGVFQRRRVQPGLQGAELTYIKQGLKAGERVVISGALLLNSELSSNE